MSLAAVACSMAVWYKSKYGVVIVWLYAILGIAGLGAAITPYPDSPAVLRMLLAAYGIVQVSLFLLYRWRWRSERGLEESPLT
jgi:Sec-independent protein secretion pathway component TatC